MNFQNINKMSRYSLTFIVLFIFVIPSRIFSQANGEEIFTSVCSACHTLGKGRLVGPDLANIQDRLDEAWIKKFIKSSQAMVKSGDPDAAKIFNEYNKIIMPDQSLTDAQLNDLLNYIKENSPSEADVKKGTPPPFTIMNSIGLYLNEAGEEEFDLGWRYFSGKEPFESGVPSCLSCHNVDRDQFIGGGLLAKDLTGAFSRLKASGINSIISAPPFPAMKAAFGNKTLTNDEKYYILAFLQQADKNSKNMQPNNIKTSFILSGIAGVFILFLIFGLIWQKRKKDSVKKDIFNRQLKSE